MLTELKQERVNWLRIACISRRLLCLAFLPLALSACALVQQAGSPEAQYSANAAVSKVLQVPPDLTDVSNGEQFILPGISASAVAQNSLLPEFSSVKYVRRGDQNWLEIAKTPEELWPHLLSFLRKQKFSIEETEPVAGLMVTQWRSNAESEGGLLKNLINKDASFSRIAFRMERIGTNGVRVFARSQVASAESARELSGAQWPADSHDPEKVSLLLQQLLVFLGVDEQRAKGLLNEAQASAVLDKASIQTTAAGSQILFNKGYMPSFLALSEAAEQLDYSIQSSNDTLGKLQLSKTGSNEQPLVLQVTPLHVGAVSVSVLNNKGARLPNNQELAVLRALRDQLI